ncbi:hypothetical protein [Haladaptatus halobius]|nr:hypothetical protein [Haladaptatus halobius]
MTEPFTLTIILGIAAVFTVAVAILIAVANAKDTVNIEINIGLP